MTRTPGRKPEAPGFGSVLSLWMALSVLIHGALWFAGFAGSEIGGAVEKGAARVESLGIGEIGDDLIRKSIRTQHDTLPFWTVLAVLGDFLVEPVSLAARALAVATAFSALAALTGRPVGYDRALFECSAAQGVWVLGLAIGAALMIVLRRADVETSAVLLLPAGAHSATVWLALRQLDVFAISGWTVLAIGGIRRGQVGPLGALAVCGSLALGEAAVRTVAGLVVGAGMRLTVLPET